jgi:hypothetical protein
MFQTPHSGRKDKPPVVATDDSERTCVVRWDRRFTEHTFAHESRPIGYPAAKYCAPPFSSSDSEAEEPLEGDTERDLPRRRSDALSFRLFFEVSWFRYSTRRRDVDAWKDPEEDAKPRELFGARLEADFAPAGTSRDITQETSGWKRGETVRGCAIAVLSARATFDTNHTPINN